MIKPIVFGGYINGYGIIRGLADKGISSLLIERKGKKSEAAVSKYVQKVYYFSDPELEKEQFLNEMHELGVELAPDKGILFPTHDEYVITLWENQEKLASYFEFPMSDWSIVKQLINKKELYLLCESIGIDCPKTQEIKSYKEFLKIKESFLFPIIVKPSVWDTELVSEMGQKVFIFTDKEEADCFVKRVYEHINCDTQLLIQEFIEGELIKLPDITVFCNKEGKVKSWTAAVKLRQFPPQTGTSTMATILSPDMEMCRITFEMTKKLVEKVGFYGICDAEYMYDKRDGKYKMIEVNTRFHMQNYMICASGVNMAYYIFCEHQNLPYKYNRVPKRLVSWCKPIEDKYNATRYNKKKYKGFGISKRQWKETIPKDTIGIMNNYKDIRVYMRYAFGIYRRMISDKIRLLFRVPDGVSLKKFLSKR